MNILQFAGAIIYATGLIQTLQTVHFEKKGKLLKFIACLVSGTVLCSMNSGMNLKITAALSIFADMLILVPFIGKIKKQ